VEGNLVVVAVDPEQRNNFLLFFCFLNFRNFDAILEN